MRIRLSRGLVLALLAAALTGCAPSTDYSARFVRYDLLQDGTRVAIVVPVGQPDDEQTAYVSRSDLKPGEVVFVRATGRDWDQPQWKPEREIVETNQ
jgi:hypothetical protein